MLDAFGALTRPIPNFTLKRRLAPYPAKKGSSLERVAHWHAQHPPLKRKGEDPTPVIKPDHRFVVKYVRGPDFKPVPQRFLTRLRGIRLDANGKPRSKTYSYAGKR